MNFPSSGPIEAGAEDGPGERWHGDRFRGSIRTLRVLAVHILALGVLDMALGVVLTGERAAQEPYSSASLALHAAIGLLMAGMSAYAFVVSLRSAASTRARAAAGLTFASVLAASVAGAAFLYGGEDPALIGPKGLLGGLTLIGSALLLAWTRPRAHRWDDQCDPLTEGPRA